MQSLFDQKTFQEIQQRLANLKPETTPLWGKMNAGQMLKHCQRPLEIAVYDKDFGLKSNFLIRTFFKKSMYDDRPFMKNMPTPKAFKVTEAVDFNLEHDNLLKLIEKFYGLRDKLDWKPHPVFGKLSQEQWGKIQYKHLDHHLNQFKV
ncbi:MAG: hypothetical protein CMF34_13685 [Leeuwenhoekiella sp.]|uniref:DUF1569 domain-containing protein n=1 Tax=unclassified Leeuwenhoekiella TaxID=2615029 RepID=UPI000C497122|nr:MULTISPECIES: DUF1569 domain-containing protein [unclassified Leeuwenhoekiella]MAS21284.1 hypothetical protein [Leeuwenhoekiella sp.]MAW93924.1 hypothetical protein [Leeuwenhoekiella sp.]MBA81662.1 hypothetical protein [Leeuwenhoekiella sp.]|tara:strand:+ start:15465 stop:15908 length:444 start_codon:yes stop_codon:yes gene_type:complete